MKSLWKEQSGFSLVQVMVAGGLMGVLAMFGMKMFANQQKMTAKFQSDADIAEFRYNLINFLNTGETCTNALEGVALGESLQNLWFTDPSNIFISVGDQIPGSSWEIASLNLLTDTQASNAGLTVNAASSTGVKNIYLRVGLTDTGKTIGGKDKYIYFKTVATVGDLLAVYDSTVAATKSRCYSINNGILYDSYKNTSESYKDTNIQEPLSWDGSKFFGQCLVVGGSIKMVYKCGN